MKKAVKIVLITVLAAALITAGVLFWINKVNSSRYIGQDAAKEIAMQDAGLSKDAVRFHDVDQESREGIVYYDVEMVSDGIKYEYKIDAATGSVLVSDTENVFD